MGLRRAVRSPPAAPDARALSAAALANALAREQPHYSAYRRLTAPQMVVLYLLATAALAAFTVAPRLAGSLIVAVLALIFLAGFAYKALLFLIGAAPGSARAPDRADDAPLPLYTILVPLYREARVVPVLIRALTVLDYPRERLDIKLIIEDDDDETRAALAALNLRAPFDIVSVPPVGPRTKPKALAIALREARGAFLVVYDAEDQPEPDQLRRALARFAALGPRTVCLQARLNFFNARENWLTRLFAIDYCLWFDALLRGLERLGAPLPLGGTSNHFRKDALVALGGWDPYNVTEDADLGFRIAREGLSVATLDSTTFEEAPTRLGPWLAQRTRWIKGYLQTYFVHMRAPSRFHREAGWRGTLTLHLVLLATVIGGLTSPVLWVMFVCWALTGEGLLSGFTGGALLAVSLFGLVAGNALIVFLSLLAPLRRGWLNLVPYALTVPAYWLLVSLAAWRAAGGFLLRPFYWAKTPHGLTRFEARAAPGDAGGHV